MRTDHRSSLHSQAYPPPLDTRGTPSPGYPAPQKGYETRDTLPLRKDMGPEIIPQGPGIRDTPRTEKHR